MHIQILSITTVLFFYIKRILGIQRPSPIFGDLCRKLFFFYQIKRLFMNNIIIEVIMVLIFVINNIQIYLFSRYYNI